MCVVIFTEIRPILSPILQIFAISVVILPLRPPDSKLCIFSCKTVTLGFTAKINDFPEIQYGATLRPLVLSSFDYILKVLFRETSLAYLCPAVPYMAIKQPT